MVEEGYVALFVEFFIFMWSISLTPFIKSSKSPFVLPSEYHSLTSPLLNIEAVVICQSLHECFCTLIQV